MRRTPHTFAVGATALACALTALLAASSCRDAGIANPVSHADHSTPGAVRRLRRLSAREYVRVVSDLVGVDVAVTRFLPDSFDTGYDNGAANLNVQAEQAVLYETLADEVASAALAAHKDRLLAGCDPSQGADACRRVFFDGFATRAFRRPLSPGEATRLGALFDATVRSASFDVALETTTAALLESPEFLYREELGEGAPALDGSVHLTPYELASELSFFLTGSMPDDALFTAASSGQLVTPDDLRREAARLLSTPRATEQLRHFLDDWLVTSRLSTTSKDPVAYKALDAPLADAMRTELDRFYDLVLTDEGTLRELFGSETSFVNARLAAHYGAAAPGTSQGDGFAQVALDTATRRGILTRAGFLTVHSGYDNSNPIERGVFVRNAILCTTPHPPPPGIPRNVPPDSARTTRERYAQHTADAFCQGCHKAIDGVGFGFEQFDAIGALRLQENGVTVDTSGNLYDSDGADGPFLGATELEARLMESPRLGECFVRQMFRFSMGSGETATDDASVKGMSAAFSTQTKLTDLALDLVGRRMFTERLTEGP